MVKGSRSPFRTPNFFFFAGAGGGAGAEQGSGWLQGGLDSGIFLGLKTEVGKMAGQKSGNSPKMGCPGKGKGLSRTCGASPGGLNLAHTQVWICLFLEPFFGWF